MTPCVIVGQSNSIIEGGYASNLIKSGDISLVGECRLGASPSVIGPFFLNDDMLSRAEYCLVDLCVVDFSVLQWRAASYYDIIGWVEWTAHKARINDCEPVFILIPVSHYIKKGHLLLDIYRSIIRRGRYYYIDVCDIVPSVGQAGGSEAEDLYKDAAHPGNLLSQIIADALRAFFNSGARHKKTPVEFEVIMRRFTKLHPSERIEGDYEKANYKSSLVSFEGIRINAEARVFMKTERFSRLSALMVNAARCHRKISIAGSATITKNLNLRCYTKGAQFEARVISIQGQISDDNGRISLAIAEADAISSEMTMEEQTPSASDPPWLEMSSVLAETGFDVVNYTYHAPEPGYLNIGKLLL